MKKRIFVFSGIFIFLVVLVMAFFKNSNVIDVTGEYLNSGILNRRFVTKVDLFVVQSSDSEQKQFERMEGGMPNKKQLASEYPMKWYGDTIYGVLPKDSRFRISGIKRSTSSTMGRDFYSVTVESEGAFKGQEICTRFLEFNQENKVYDPQVVVELIQAQGK